MIKVNLLPTKRKKKAKPIPGFLVAMVALLLVTGAISGYAVYYMNNKISDLQAQKTKNEKVLKKLAVRMKEVERFEALNKTFQDRKNIILELTKNQSLPVKIIDQVSITLTSGVWIGNLDIKRGKITIKGTGFSNADIVTYIQSLKAAELFSNVVLHGTTRKSIGGVEAYEFSVSFEVKA